MDKQLLDALNNLSSALDQIANALSSKNKPGETQSPISEALKGGNFIEQIASIDQGVKQLIQDNKKILSNQQTILQMSKKEKSSSESKLFGGADDNKEKIKSGVSTILLIAVGVLAIGMAFKLIGGVNIGSVLAIAIALPLIAYSFQKIAEIKELTGGNIKNLALTVIGMSGAVMVSSWLLSMVSPVSIAQGVTILLITTSLAIASTGISDMITKLKGVSLGDMIKLPIVLVAVSAAITASSWILQGITPIGIFQALTAIMIAGTFAVISYSLGRLVSTLKEVSPKDVWKLPIVLVAASTAITASSWILQGVKPIGLFQAITSIMIAGMFAVVSFSLGKLVSSLKDVDPKVAVVLPIILVAVSAAIAASSWVLSTVKPIGLFQFLTAVGIGIAFIPISFALPMITKAVKGLSIKDIIMTGLVMVGIAGVITASSYILSEAKTIPLGKLFNIAAMSVSLAVSVSAMGLAFKLLAGKVGISDVIKGGIAVIGIATTIMVASLILDKGEYKNYPSLSWTLGTTLAMIPFGLGMVVLGDIVTSGIGALAMLAGAASMVLVAGTIVATSFILSKGDYKNYPSLSWSLGVGLSMVGFGTGMVALGGIIMASFGLGAAALALGANAVTSVADTIVKTSHILSKGNYKSYPTLGWSMGVGLSLAAFTTGMVMLGGILLASFGLGQKALDMGSTAILSVANTIVASSFILSKGKWSGGPPKDWSEGVAIALGAFAPVYKMLMANKLMKMFGGGVGPKDFVNAIITISTGMVTAAKELAKSPGVWKNGPSKEWAEGVSLALGGFAPLFKVLNDSKNFLGFGGMDPEEMNAVIVSLADSIVKVGDKLSTGKFGADPNPSWANSISSSVRSFINIFKSVKDADMDEDDVTEYGNILNIMVGKLKTVNDKLFLLSSKASNNQANSVKGIAETIKSFIDLNNYLAGGAGSNIDTTNIANTVDKMAKSYSVLSKSIKELGASINTIDSGKLSSIRLLTGNVAILSMMDPGTLEAVLNKFAQKAPQLADSAAAAANESVASGLSVLSNKKGEDANKKTTNDIYEVLTAMDSKLNTIATNSTSLANYINEIRGGDVGIKHK